MRGRLPKPTVIKILEGNRGKRRLPDNEPQPRSRRPRCPEYLTEDGQKEWRRVLKILYPMRVVTEADEYTLGTLVQNYETMKEAQRLLNKSGIIIKEGTSIKRNPLVDIVRKSSEQITVLSREFGMTPSSRVRLVAKETPPKKGSGLLDGEWQERSA